MVFAVEGWEERLLSSLHAYVWLVLLKLHVTAWLFVFCCCCCCLFFVVVCFVVVVVRFIFVVLICAGINIAVQGSLFTVANEVVHPNFQVSRSVEILCRQVQI